MSNTKLYYLAVCDDCKPRLSLPFENEDLRDKWVIGHEQHTEHTVTIGQKWI